MEESNQAKPECQEALDTLYRFLDGELTETRRSEIEHHLEACSPCLGAFDFEAELKVVIARRCRDEVPETLRRRVAAALAEASRSPQTQPLLNESQDR
jgi:mycothiol system anti-sigma-R factor